jgi:hypothetical protein
MEAMTSTPDLFSALASSRIREVLGGVIFIVRSASSIVSPKQVLCIRLANRSIRRTVPVGRRSRTRRYTVKMVVIPRLHDKPTRDISTASAMG